jgi:hypothetical protein
MRDLLGGRYRLVAWTPLCLVLVLWPQGPAVSRSGYGQTEKALGALRRAFDYRDQAEVLFQPAFLDAQRSVSDIAPIAPKRWWRIDPDRLAQKKATACIAFLRSYREDLRSAELSLDATRGREIDVNGEFADALADAERQTQAATRCMSDVERYLRR